MSLNIFMITKTSFNFANFIEMHGWCRKGIIEHYLKTNTFDAETSENCTKKKSACYIASPYLDKMTEKPNEDYTTANDVTFYCAKLYFNKDGSINFNKIKRYNFVKTCTMQQNPGFRPSEVNIYDIFDDGFFEGDDLKTVVNCLQLNNITNKTDTPYKTMSFVNNEYMTHTPFIYEELMAKSIK